jgi:predicted nucleic acid-binding protein
MGLVLDTSALVELERRALPLEAGLQPYLDAPLAVPMVVWAELLVGVRMAADPDRIARRRSRLEQLRLRVPLVPFDAAIAEDYADIFAECLRSGRMVPQNVMEVAATARKLGYAVLVGRHDEAHFRSVKRLDVIALPVS